MSAPRKSSESRSKQLARFLYEAEAIAASTLPPDLAKGGIEWDFTPVKLVKLPHGWRNGQRKRLARIAAELAAYWAAEKRQRQALIAWHECELVEAKRQAAIIKDREETAAIFARETERLQIVLNAAGRKAQEARLKMVTEKLNRDPHFVAAATRLKQRNKR